MLDDYLPTASNRQAVTNEIITEESDILHSLLQADEKSTGDADVTNQTLHTGSDCLAYKSWDCIAPPIVEVRNPSPSY